MTIHRGTDAPFLKDHDMNRPKLTNRQQAVLGVIEGYVHSHGYGPSIREIGGLMEIKSPNGVVCHLKALEEKGYIARDKNTSRAIRLVTEWHESGDNVLRLLRHMIDVSVRLDTAYDVLDVMDHPERFEDDWNAMEAARCPDTPTA